ncbi:MAG: hypothetical protein C4291_08305, partial [Candidatus Dadabacteria bacterium]
MEAALAALGRARNI